MLAPWKKRDDKPRQHIKKQRYYFAYKGPYSQSYMDVRAGQIEKVLPVVMYGCEGWAVEKAEPQTSNCDAGEYS